MDHRRNCGNIVRWPNSRNSDGDIRLNSKIISYETLRKLIGVLAMMFPLVLLLGYILGGGEGIPESLSITYWSNVRDVFTSMLITFSIFLFSYKGYDKPDNYITNLSATSFLIVALFPCSHTIVQEYLFSFIPVNISGIIHEVSAAIGFTLLGVMSLTQFTKGYQSPTGHKVFRNRVYRFSGVTILCSISTMLVLTLIPGLRFSIHSYGIWFLLESIILWCFGVSWLVKGGAILKDT